MPRGGLIAMLVLSAVVVSHPPSEAQSYAETERVTVVDLPVELGSLSSPEGPAARPPANLAADDFEIIVGGESQQAVAVDAVQGTGPVPHHVLVYVEPTFSDGRELQDALGWITAVASKLANRAVVDVVIADPEPRFLVQGNTDPSFLENLFTSTDWRQSATDEIRELRAGFIQALTDTESEVDLGSMQAAFALEEERMVQRRLDLLLAFLADHVAPGRQRALWLVGLQFDLDPMAFYGSFGDGAAAKSTVDSSRRGALEAGVRELAKNLGAYGWVTYPIATPEAPSPLRRGLRIGRWRVTGPAGGRIIGVRIARESERDPEVARGHLENGKALLEQGSPVEAEEAFRLALHHYYGDDRTAEEQAEATAGLAAALEAQGKSVEARSALRTASDLDEGVTVENPEALAELLDPTAALQPFVFETSGRVAREQQDLEAALVDLDRRLRVSLQLAGEPTGELMAVEVRYLRAGGLLARNPRWARFGSPPGVSAARARLLHDDLGTEPAVILDGRVERAGGAAAQATLEFRLPLADTFGEESDGRERACRLTVTALVEDAAVEIEQRPLTCRSRDGGVEGAVDLTLPEPAELVGVVVEDLASSTWGAEIFEVSGSL